MSTALSEPAALAPQREATVRRSELAAFLRSRRERLSPEQVGLPLGGRRRTPGLRREEVAQLAGVGVTWYTWLEQQRDIQPSEQVLAAIADTLRLDQHERLHLFALAGMPEPQIELKCRAIPDSVYKMIAQLEPFPVSVQNARTDILAFNRTYDRLSGGMSAMPFEERNGLLLVFTNPQWQARMPHWEAAARRLVAQFRAAMAHHVVEDNWKCLVKRLRQLSPQFEEMWLQHEVSAPENLTKTYLHPEVGLMHFDYTNLWTGPRSEVRVTTYIPSDDMTREKLETLQSYVVNDVPISKDKLLISGVRSSSSGERLVRL